MYLVPCADDCAGRPCSDAVLAVLPVHAQPVQRMRAQQAQRVHYRHADICIQCATPVRPLPQNTSLSDRDLATGGTRPSVLCLKCGLMPHFHHWMQAVVRCQHKYESDRSEGDPAYPGISEGHFMEAKTEEWKGLTYQEQQEGLVVPMAHTVANPGAMVIHSAVQQCSSSSSSLDFDHMHTLRPTRRCVM